MASFFLFAKRKSSIFEYNNHEMNEILVTNFWKRTLHNQLDQDTTWDEETGYLYRLGISMELTLQFIYESKPSLEDFKQWISTNSKVFDSEKYDENVLTAEDLQFWETNGYVIIKNAIPMQDCLETQEAIWNFLQKDPEDSSTWYTFHEAQKGLMVHFFNHPILEKNRASLKIKKAYEQLYGTDTIFKTIDKVSFNPPITEHYSFLGSNLHWDVSLQQPIPFRLQGLLYLSDCGENDGAFHCVPGFHHKIESWMQALGPNDNPRTIALETLKPEPITGNAGDFIIWHQALPHCATPNRGSKPRLVQYLTYFTENYKEAEEWI
ncbi:phytanoyl-CoA dioxygenase family protein [Flavobacterium sp. NRK F7]|uniref:phytanoyl-CoA dioxygenase family protein n=1 Tax=Flavobacterium sp. NRK F7 TaxID=2954930 RepID=UPI002090E1A2|nr:phytanoyl-CoA dioxygenase family protein [Flavobacterium sp. NRK F7]MCO6162794.1 phytanoyl-CoA dioxygenase family protein [Flavobacterium sp. NRK F7]